MAKVNDKQNPKSRKRKSSASPRRKDLNGLLRELYPASSITPNRQYADSWALGRSGDPSLQLDVDVTILDYIAFKAISSLLAVRQGQLQNQKIDASEMIDVKLDMVDSFLTYLNQKHEHPPLPLQLVFRLQLLQFVSLVTCRLNREAPPTTAESLASVRAHNLRRGQHWRAAHPSRLVSIFDVSSEFPLPPAALKSHRTVVFKSLHVSDPEPERWTDAFYGSHDCAALADLLPFFLSVIAARLSSGDGWGIQSGLAELIGEWMMQAALEQYLVCGKSGRRAIDAVFAVGFESCADEDFGTTSLSSSSGGGGGGDVALEGDMRKTLCALFSDEENRDKEMEGWEAIRMRWMSELLPSPDDPSGSVLTAMLDASATFPLEAFESSVMLFLSALHASYPDPDLQQVENGVIEGVSEEESREMFARMGIAE